MSPLRRKYCGGVSEDKEILVRTTPSSPVGMHRVVDPAGAALPPAARVLDAGHQVAQLLPTEKLSGA